jgi:hypothetical protein
MIKDCKPHIFKNSKNNTNIKVDTDKLDIEIDNQVNELIDKYYSNKEDI